MNKAVFFRKEQRLEDRLSAYEVEKVIELLPEQYQQFADNLLSDWDFLWENKELMHVDAHGIWHCFLVKAQGAHDGILVNAEGASYARYIAYCPNYSDVEGGDTHD